MTVSATLTSLSGPFRHFFGTGSSLLKLSLNGVVEVQGSTIILSSDDPNNGSKTEV